MESLKHIEESIKSDIDNQVFTAQGWEPLFMASPEAKILIIGQAPGLKTQLEKVVFKDKSGERLRNWMGINEDVFYESGLIAVLPMDFYFPGHGTSGDLPPRKSFYTKWHPRIIEMMPDIKLTLLIGKYAQDQYLAERGFGSVTENVINYELFLPKIFPLIHPSPRNQFWISKHPFYLESVVPKLRKTIGDIIGENNEN